MVLSRTSRRHGRSTVGSYPPWSSDPLEPAGAGWIGRPLGHLTPGVDRSLSNGMAPQTMSQSVCGAIPIRTSSACGVFLSTSRNLFQSEELGFHDTALPIFCRLAIRRRNVITLVSNWLTSFNNHNNYVLGMGCRRIHVPEWTPVFHAEI